MQSTPDRKGITELFYEEVVEKVVSDMKNDMLSEGMSEQTLAKLKDLWIKKLKAKDVYGLNRDSQFGQRHMIQNFPPTQVFGPPPTSAITSLINASALQQQAARQGFPTVNLSPEALQNL